MSKPRITPHWTLCVARLKAAPAAVRAHCDRCNYSVEVEAFAAGAPPQLAVPFALGLFAGMRQGDALMVTWRAYDGATISWIASKNGEECSAPVTGPFKAVLDRALTASKAAPKKKGGIRAVQIATTSHGLTWTQSGFRALILQAGAPASGSRCAAPGLHLP